MTEENRKGDEQAEATSRRRPGQSWENLIEEKIREAQERGEFDNLRGRGKPLVHAGEDSSDPAWMANHLLKNAGFKPPALDLTQEIDETLAEAKIPLERIRRRRAFLLEGGTFSEADRLRFNQARAKAIEGYRRSLKTVNDRVLALNISAPLALHRRSIPVEREIATFESECPVL